MPEYIAWADQAASNELVAPSTEKQHAGWVEGEQPPHEYFNWHQNRTDKRLDSLESPFTTDRLISKPGERAETILAGSEFTVPEYVVGASHLCVMLDSIVCLNGDTYAEVGKPGSRSTKITWLDDIDPSYQIIAWAPIEVTRKVSLVNTTVVDLEELIAQVVGQTTGASTEYTVYGVVDPDEEV